MKNLSPLLVIPMQARISDQPAYLLHRRDWKDNSLILDLFTYDYGRVSVLAKGGKNSKSRGLYQPFCRLTVGWSGQRELKTLVGIEGSLVPVDERHYLTLLYVNELLSVFLPPHESAPELFERYELFLTQFDPLFAEACLREFERSAMKILGYLPDMNRDATSDLPIQAEGFYQFFASEGFVPCASGAGNTIVGALIIDWNNRQYENMGVMPLAKAIMRSIIDFNLQGKTLKSRDVFRQIKRHT